MPYRYIPKHVDFRSHHEAAVFIDAWLPGDLGWLSAIGNRTMFRIPRFGARWTQLLSAPSAAFRDDNRELRYQFRQRARTVAGRFVGQSGVAWCSADLGDQQLTSAITDKPLGFDKAVVIASTFNELAAENRIGEIHQIGAHEIAACVFWFVDLNGWVEGAVAAVNVRREAVIRRMADSSGQSARVIDALIGDPPPKGRVLDMDAFDRAAKFTASYRTQRAIFKALQSFVPQIDARLREDVIKRKGYAGPNKRAHPDELIDSTQRITKPPYGWPDDGRGWEDYPPDPVAPAEPEPPPSGSVPLA